MTLNVNDADLRVGGNGNPLFLGGDFKVVDFLIKFPNSDWVFQVGVFPEFDFSVFSSSNKILSIFVNIQGVDWSFVGLEAGLANTEFVPNFNASVPRDSDVVGLVRYLSDSHFADDVSVLVLLSETLDLTLGVPNGGLIIKSRRINNSVVKRDSARGDLLLGSEEGLLAGSRDQVPESHRPVPRGT